MSHFLLTEVIFLFRSVIISRKVNKMLVRFILKNVLSFAESKEFNTIPNNRLKTLEHHKYDISSDFSILKIASLYGANGAGKSI